MNTDYDLEVGQRIRAVRESMHMSREKFGRLCGISPSFLAAVERGQKGITGRMVYKICSAAQLSADYIVKGTCVQQEMGDLQELIGGLDERQRRCVLRMISVYAQSVRELQNNSKE